jgi:hypothetical protein
MVYSFGYYVLLVLKFCFLYRNFLPSLVLPQFKSMLLQGVQGAPHMYEMEQQPIVRSKYS